MLRRPDKRPRWTAGRFALVVAVAYAHAATPAVARAEDSAPAGSPAAVLAPGDPDADQDAEAILAAQPRDLVDRLMRDGVVVLQEVQEAGPLRGGIISAYVIFDRPVDRVYRLLAQSSRQTEFRPELTSVETIETGPRGPVDEQRLKILFQKYVFRLAYELSPERRRIAWALDERFDNDLARVVGFWELYELDDGRTLGRSGTSIDVGPAVPAVLQDWITRKNVPETMKRVRRWVDSDGRYRP